MAPRRRLVRDVFHVGDCAHMEAIPDGSIDLVVAGPPYFTLFDYGAFARGAAHHWKDKQSYASFLDQLAAQFREVFRVLRPGRYCTVLIGTVRRGDTTYALPFHAVRLLEDVGFQFQFEIVWHKPAGGRRSALGFYRDPFPGSFTPNNVVEYVLVVRKAPSQPFSTRSAVLRHVDNAIVLDETFRRELSNNVWHIMPARGQGEHPCPFPPELPYRLISLFSLRGETVLDPYMGIGTTARAAKMLKRRFVGYEREDRYAAIARAQVAVPLRLRSSLLLKLERGL